MIIQKLVDYLIKALKQCPNIETDKYQIMLQSVKEDTAIGRTYKIDIITEYKGYEGGTDKE